MSAGDDLFGGSLFDYMEPTPQIREKMTVILHTWGEEQPETAQVVNIKPSPERERFSVPHAARDPQVLKDRNLEYEDIFELIKNPPEIGAVRIFEEPEFSKNLNLGHIHRPRPGSNHAGHCYREFTIGPLKHGWNTMAPFETYPYERCPQFPRSKSTERTHSTAKTRQGQTTQVFLLETASNIKKYFPRYSIPRGYSLNHPPLLQECKKRSGKNLGRGNR